MASLYKRKDSPFLWIQYIDEKGCRKLASTGCRWDDKKQVVQAKMARAKLEAREYAPKPSNHGWAWVNGFLERRCKSPKTLIRYTGCWQWVEFWLGKKGIKEPSEVTYVHAIDYLQWRLAEKRKSGKVVAKNTALLEIKIFSFILSEAVKLGYCQVNPWLGVGIAKDKAKEKPEITDEEIGEILVALENEEPWMKQVFLISLYTGCRLNETQIPRNSIDLKKRTITFPSPKGGDKRAFTVPVPAQLLKFLKQWIKDDVMIKVPRFASRDFTRFFRKIGKGHLCFHCLRVTFVTRLLRADVPTVVAMRLVNHSSEMVHRIYQRIRVEDVRKYANVIRFPSLSAKPRTVSK